MKTGNVNHDMPNKRAGFILSGFKHAPDALFESDFPVDFRWIQIPAGDSKPEAHSSTTTKALVVLVKGEHHVSFGSNGETVILKNEGDYVFIDADEMHSWEAKQDTTLVVLRWPVQ